jgi:hypothetical protein
VRSLLAMADTFESANGAADAVRATYAKEKPDDDPDVVVTTFMTRERLQAKPVRRRRGRVRECAGQARPNLRHTGRDAQPSRAARHDRDLGRLDVDVV